MAIQTSSRHPQTRSRHPEIHYFGRNGSMGESRILQLFSIVLALIYSRHSPEGPENLTGGVGDAHGGRRDHQDRHQDGHQEHV